MFKQLMLFVMWMSIVASIVAVFARVWQPVELEAYKAGTETGGAAHAGSGQSV
nr:hypothetical protein [Vibrio cidicii]